MLFRFLPILIFMGIGQVMAQSRWTDSILSLPPEQQVNAAEVWADSVFRADPDRVLQNLQQLVLHYEKEGQHRKQISLLSTEGAFWERYGKLNEALKAYLQALDLAETHAPPAVLGNCLNNLGALYFLKKEYEKAYDYWIKAYAAKEKSGEPLELASVSNNLSSALMRLKRLEEAEQYVKRSLELYRKEQDTAHYAAALMNLGIFRFRQTGNPDTGLFYLKQVYQLAGQAGDRSIQAQAALNTGYFYTALDQWQEAIRWFSEAEQTAREMRDFAVLRQSLGNLAESYETTRQFEEAYAYFRAYSSLNDSLNTAQAQTEIARIEERFEVARKDKTIVQQEAALEQSRNRNLLLLLLSVILVLLLLGLLLYFRQRKKLNEQLEAEKTALYVNMVHEFRTPLSLVLATMEEHIRKGVDLRASDEVAYRNALQLNLMINQLLDIARTGKWSQEPVFKTGDLINLLREMPDFFRVLAIKKNIQLVFEPRINSNIRSFDADKLEKILFNLLGNALKYTPEGGEVRLVLKELRQEKNQELLILEVTDNGPGIPEAEQQNLGKRFFRASHTLGGTGTGIGLSLSMDLAKAAGGTLSWDIKEGNGSCFRLEFPVFKPGADAVKTTRGPDWLQQYLELFAAESLPEQPQPEDPDPVTTAVQIVLVEDDPEMRITTASLLEKAGYQVQSFADAEQALPFITQSLPELVVSDVVLPGRDGITLCREIKETPLTAHIPVILLTGRSSFEHKLEGLRSGADAYLPKPFSVVELEIRVQRLIDLRKVLRRVYAGEPINTPTTAPTDAFLQQLRTWLESNLEQETLDVEQICQAMGVSRTQLHRKLKQTLGVSATRYVRQVRMEKAIELLRSGEWNISEVAFQVGFNSLSYFTRCFTEDVGMPPSQFVKKT